jgi:hypothetical protein
LLEYNTVPTIVSLVFYPKAYQYYCRPGKKNMAKSHPMCPSKHQLPEPLRQRGFAVYRGKTHDKGGLCFSMVHGNVYPNLFTLHPLPPIPSHCFLPPSFRPHTTVYSHLSDAESTTKFFLHVFPPPIAPLTATTNVYRRRRDASLSPSQQIFARCSYM